VALKDTGSSPVVHPIFCLLSLTHITIKILFNLLWL